jgi:hypothetical protein
MKPDEPCVLALSALVLDRVSPAEVPLVQAIGPQMLAARRRRRRPRDGALGLGVDEFAWTIAVLPVANNVVTWLLEQARDFATEEFGRGARTVLDWLRGRKAATGAADLESTPQLSPRVAAELWKVTYRNCIDAGVDESKARLIANATAGPFGAPSDLQ